MLQPGCTDCQFLSSVATHEVLRPQRLPEYLGEQPERTIACLVPVGVIEALEVIEIGHCHGQIRFIAPDSRDELLE